MVKKSMLNVRLPFLVHAMLDGAFTGLGRTPVERQPSANLDDSDRARRILMLTAKYAESDGEYICNVSSRRPMFADSCTTRLRVLRT